MNNNRIKLENNILIFGEKPKEFNMFYELNNNGEVDNGILIKSNTNTTSSIESYKNSKNNNNNKKIIKGVDLNLNYESIVKSQRKNNNRKEIDFKIILEIEKMGYDKDYVINCLKRKKLCHATSLYFLLENYENI